MSKQKKDLWEDPAAVVVVFGLLVWAFGAQHDWQVAAILVGVALIFIGWYVAVVHPHRCNEPLITRPQGPGCRNKAFGLLFGCRAVHHFDRLGRLLSSGTKRHNGSGVPVTSMRRATATKVPAVTADAPTLAPRFTLCCTAISTVAGVISVVVGIMALPSS
jgi:hypothetical protein